MRVHVSGAASFAGENRIIKFGSKIQVWRIVFPKARGQPSIFRLNFEDPPNVLRVFTEDPQNILEFALS